MFSYISSHKFSFKLDVSLLSEEKDESFLEQIAIWTEKKWGYLRGNPGIEKRKELTKAIQDKIYLVKYGNHLVGIFALHNHALLESETKSEEKIQVKELTHVYVDERFRGSSVGSRIVNIAKETAKAQGANLIILDTLNPTLNKFYERHGAKVICDNQFLGHPSTLLRMKLS